MLPKWGRFVTAVKLNRGLRDSNYDQLYAYLKQHETHANENKIMLDRFSQHTVDPLALMSNVSHQQHYSQSSLTPPSTYVPPHLANNTHRDSGGQQNRGHGTNPRGGDTAGFRGVQNRVGNANPGQARQDLALNVDNVFQADDCDAFDSDVDEAPMAQPCSWPICHLQILLMMKSDHRMIQTFYLRFELTEREQKINEQLRLIISDRNFKEETLKKELHSVKLQLASTINHNKLMVEEVTSLKKDFKHKENKYHEDFLDIKSLKEKPALYNGHEIIKDNHVSAIVCNIKDTLEIAEITRRKINDKVKDPECVTHKVKITPHDYSKENFLATFTPHKQLNPEQIFWSHDLIKMKSEALKEQTAFLDQSKR
nr:hypothetical protein [Tanacetum cinerariifolium]